MRPLHYVKGVSLWNCEETVNTDAVKREMRAKGEQDEQGTGKDIRSESDRRETV